MSKIVREEVVVVGLPSGERRGVKARHGGRNRKGLCRGKLKHHFLLEAIPSFLYLVPLLSLAHLTLIQLFPLP